MEKELKELEARRAIVTEELSKISWFEGRKIYGEIEEKTHA
jgi:hypothetical protein